MFYKGIEEPIAGYLKQNYIKKNERSEKENIIYIRCIR